LDSPNLPGAALLVFRPSTILQAAPQLSVNVWRLDAVTPMTKKLTSRGRHTVLPILGDTLVEIRLSMCSLPALVFKAADSNEAELTIEDSITLKRGDQERLLEGSKPGVSFNPKELAPLLELLGSEVTDAVAEKEGLLRIAFSNKLVLEVAPSHGYEAWHFHYPRPGRPVGGNREQAVALTGAHGHLI
jgi:hypothetical protein